VLIMIEAHTLDAWTRIDERGHGAYGWAMVIGGFGAPTFLFLAGLAIALSRDKYCSVWHTFRRDIDLTTTFEIHA